MANFKKVDPTPFNDYTEIGDAAEMGSLNNPDDSGDDYIPTFDEMMALLDS